IVSNYEGSKGLDISNITFTIAGVTDRWPGFIHGGFYLRESYLITSREILEIIMKESPPQQYLWCKLTTGYDQAIVDQVLDIARNFGLSKYDIRAVIEDVNAEASSNIERDIVWIVTNFNFITSLAVIFAFIMLFTFTRMIRHATEIGLSRALGMKYLQVFLLMFTEPLLLFVISGVPGAFFGTALLISVVMFMKSAFQGGPPFVLLFDPATIVLIFVSLFVVTVLSGFIMSIMATRANISKILKVE
ncbi:MAG: ABC transporter permease, partial [Candidatus Hodarchaeales archaeon]